MPKLQTLHENIGFLLGSKQMYYADLHRHEKYVSFSKSLLFLSLVTIIEKSCTPSSNCLGPNLLYISLLKYKLRKGNIVTDNICVLLFLLFFDIFTSSNTLSQPLFCFIFNFYWSAVDLQCCVSFGYIAQ